MIIFLYRHFCGVCKQFYQCSSNFFFSFRIFYFSLILINIYLLLPKLYCILYISISYVMLLWILHQLEWIYKGMTNQHANNHGRNQHANNHGRNQHSDMNSDVSSSFKCQTEVSLCYASRN